MTHEEFVAAYRAGSIRIAIDSAAAARYLSARLILPFVVLPVLGAGTALALSGWLWTGFAVIGIGTLAPVLIKRSAPHFVITHALQDEKFYGDVVGAKVLQIETVSN
ncbi:MAG TPA: hypothetical protein VM164_09855 [Burkholderiales bacterium]|nr:hypothetical protein [Burkholderiales bacterium]